MILLESEELLEHTKPLIHEDTQRHKLHLDLTAGEVHRFTGSGSLDFGGSEFKPAKNMVIEPEKQDPADDYGWWNLDEGTYRVQFNEKLQYMEDALVALTPHEHALEAGVMADTVLVSSENLSEHITYNFRVPEFGCRIKENARFASLFILAK